MTRPNYTERAAQFESTADALNQRYNRLSIIRLLIFLGGIAAVILLWNGVHALAGVGSIIIFLAGFYRFVTWHQRLKTEEQHQRNLAKVNTWEAAVEQHDFSNYDDGTRFLDQSHPNAIDLDLYGPFSMFQYLNRAVTALGQQMLARWLAEPAAPEAIQQRQEGLKELGTILDWRQHFQAYGLETEDNLEQISLLHRWMKEPPFLTNKKWVAVALYAIPVWSVAAAVIWALYLPWYLGILLYLPALLILRQFVERVNETHQKTTHAEMALRHYAQLIQHIEGQTFQSPFLRQLHDELSTEGQPASAMIRRLSYIIRQLNVRYNAFSFIFNIFGLWELQYVYRLEQWKAAVKGHLPRWFEAMASFEALSSLGNLHHNNPEWNFPAITNSAVVEAEALGHPLLHRDKRVCNDIHLPTNGHIKLITGSNMAGKSTFLRTVGLNMVLAMCGAPVCARRMTLPPLQVYTSMRTQDALQESTSSFYAELKRLKFIIEAVEDTADHQPPQLQAFFLLDEILKGTNSNDRHTGSKALIRQLIRSRGSGIIATHDLELGQLEAEANGTIENLRIEVEIQGGELHFDYKLKKGVSQSFNATLLMKRMGIKIEE
ncbi:MAG: hypothetical protein RIC19_22040 [Phaeodactylibacter sp.]|uniref:MutS family DNA mismatch repair protein n=1 Tax=Phaeodactylibacter sp. TaxID=1940289 RepID=UPI0032EED3E9